VFGEHVAVGPTRAAVCVALACVAGAAMEGQNAVLQWTRTRGWTKALLAFKIQLGDRLPD
jgi:hypothetical protein